MNNEKFNKKIFGILSEKNITLTELNPEEKELIENNISNITNTETLETIFTGHINTTPFIVYRNNQNIIISTNTLTLLYNLNDQNENLDINIIKHMGHNITKQYKNEYLKISQKTNELILTQEESKQKKQYKGFDYHTKKSFNAIQNTQKITITIDIHWKEQPSHDKQPPLIIGNIKINEDNKNFAFLLQNETYIAGNQSDIKTYEELQKILKENGNISLHHSKEFIDIISNEIIKPEFIKAIETLLKNNIQIENNILKISGHQFKLQFPHKNNID